MSGQTGTDDIVENDATAFVVAVPSTDNTEFTNLLRLGHANPADEGKLAQDPAAKTPTLISAWSATASPFSDGELAYSTGTTQLVAPYGYIRIGTATTYEGWLPDDAATATGKAIAPPAGTPPTTFDADSVLIYSSNTVQLFAPTISQTTNELSSWSSDNLSVIADSSNVISATRSWGSGDWPASATYQRVDAMNSTLGTTTNLVTGNAMTQWVGNDASTGLGGLLWSNYGHTQNVFGGWIVNMINSAIDVQGFNEVKILTDYQVDALAAIRLLVTEGSEISGLTSSTIAKVGWITAAVSALALAGLNLTSSVSVDRTGAAATQPTTDAASGSVTPSSNTSLNSAMRTAMETSFVEVTAASALILLTQAMAIAAGVAANFEGAAAQASAGAGLEITPLGILMQAGPTKMLIDATGIAATAPVVQQVIVQNLIDAG